MLRLQKLGTGFSLIELLIVITIVGIMAAVALPSYTGYVLRSKFTEPTAQLSDMRVKLEQFYQDNRNYGATAAICGAALPVAASVRYFAYTCDWGVIGTNQGFTVTATGIVAQGTDGIVFTIDQSNARTTVITGGTSIANAGFTVGASTCWVQKKPAVC